MTRKEAESQARACYAHGAKYCLKLVVSMAEKNGQFKVLTHKNRRPANTLKRQGWKIWELVGDTFFDA